ncbi:MAG: LCP family protein [Actinobacteria bacterium]|nr:LCP family protein [Actinomycetota bacterium]
MKLDGNTSLPKDSYPARLLRALYSAIIPGLGQLVAGVRQRGFVLLGISLVVPVATLVVLTQGVDAVLAYLVQPKILLALLGVNIGILILRSFAVLDAWMTAKSGAARAARPPAGRRLLAGTGLALVLVFMAAPHAAAGYYIMVSHDLLTSVFAGDGDGNATSSTLLTSTIPSSTIPPSSLTSVASGATVTSGTSTTRPTNPPTSQGTTTTSLDLGSNGRMTVLLIGTDAGYRRSGARADSINVASLDLATGDVALFGIPRNAAETDLGKKTAGALKMTTFNDIINALYEVASEHPEIAPNGGDPGAEAVRESASLILGIPIDYYVVVNMLGLADLVDAFGGVDINLRTPLHITYAPLARGEGKTSYTFHVGVNHMDGLEALAYARDRSDSDDYVRMGRQRCVLLGLLYQSSVSKLTLRFPKIAAAIKKNVKTNIPVDALPQLVRMRSKIKTNEMIAVGFSPPVYNISRSTQGTDVLDIPLIQKTVQTILESPDKWIAEHPAASKSGSDCYKVKK